MISNKRIFLISVIVVVIVAAIAVVPGQHPLVTSVTASANPGTIILRCAATANQNPTVYSFDSLYVYPFPEPTSGYPCVDVLAEILGAGYVREDYGEVLAARVQGDLQISTWVFTGSPPPGS